MLWEVRDTYQHKGLRKKLVDLLKNKGITDEKVLDAINAIPASLLSRFRFLIRMLWGPRLFPSRKANHFTAIHCSLSNTILQIKKMIRFLRSVRQRLPATVLRNWVPGYLPSSARKIYTICRKNIISAASIPTLKSFLGDVSGLPTFAPFDKIIITAAAPFYSPKLWEQLKPCGLIGHPRRRRRNPTHAPASQSRQMVLLRKKHLNSFSFVPMLSGEESVN